MFSQFFNVSLWQTQPTLRPWNVMRSGLNIEALSITEASAMRSATVLASRWHRKTAPFHMVLVQPELQQPSANTNSFTWWLCSSFVL